MSTPTKHMIEYVLEVAKEVLFHANPGGIKYPRFRSAESYLLNHPPTCGYEVVEFYMAT